MKNKFEELIEAIKINEFKKIQQLLQDIPDLISQRDDDLSTILHIASSHGNSEIVEFLIKKGADVNVKNNTDFTPLHIAAQNGHLDIVKTLINEKAAINAQDDVKWTSLHEAVFYEHFEIVKFLVESGIDVNIKNNFNQTGLDIAIDRNYQEIEIFLKKEMENQLLSAAKKGNSEIIESLIKAKIDIKAKDETGKTVLDIARDKNDKDTENLIREKTKNELLIAIKEGNLEKIQQLLQMMPYLINAKYEDGNSLLHIAIQHKNVDILKFLANTAPILVNTPNINGTTPLHMICKSEISDQINIVIAKILIELGAKVNAEDHTRMTPLHFATYLGKAEIIDILIKNGANIKAKNTSGITVIDVAINYKGTKNPLITIIKNQLYETIKQGKNFAETQELLRIAPKLAHIKYENNQNLLNLAAFFKNTKMVEILINAEPNFVNERNDDNQTPLLTCFYDLTSKDTQIIIEMLIKAGADINAQDKIGETSLRLAVKFGQTKLVEMLIEKGADIKLKNRDGETALSCAINHDNKKIKDLLIKKAQNQLLIAIKKGNSEEISQLLQAAPDLINTRYENSNNTPLHIACYYENPKIVKLLVGKNANIYAKNKDNKTILDIATETDQQEIVKFLKTTIYKKRALTCAMIIVPILVITSIISYFKPNFFKDLFDYLKNIFSKKSNNDISNLTPTPSRTPIFANFQCGKNK